jgi:hypothetical protein
VYPPSKIFAKLVNKNAIKHQKVVPSPKNFHNPYIHSLPKFGKNLPDPPPGFSNCVHLRVCLLLLYQQFHTGSKTNPSPEEQEFIKSLFPSGKSTELYTVEGA